MYEDLVTALEYYQQHLGKYVDNEIDPNFHNAVVIAKIRADLRHYLYTIGIEKDIIEVIMLGLQDD